MGWEEVPELVGGLRYLCGHLKGIEIDLSLIEMEGYFLKEKQFEVYPYPFTFLQNLDTLFRATAFVRFQSTSNLSQDGPLRSHYCFPTAAHIPQPPAFYHSTLP